MKKIFEEPTVDCIRISSEEITTGAEGGLPSPEFSTDIDDF